MNASSMRPARSALPIVVLMTVAAGIVLAALALPPEFLREMLRRWEFWLLEGLFACVVVTTMIEAKRVPIDRRLALWAAAAGVAATVLSACVAPRTNRIFYDEQIYQGVAQNLADLHLAQMCNDGDVESRRLQCSQGEFNKEPNGYPYLLSIVYRLAGVRANDVFYFNNVVAGLTTFLVIVLGELFFADTRAALLSGMVLALLPMQLWWTNTASAEPSAVLLTAAAVLTAVHFARSRTTSALAWTVAVTAFATTVRPESVMVLPLVVVVVLLFAPDTLRRRPVWWAAAAGTFLCLPALLHLMSVRNEKWGAQAARFGWQYVKANLPLNSWFYLGRDERFPVLIAVAALVGLAASRHIKRQALLLGIYFLSFWGICVAFYAGSYYYGADVRYSLLSHVPLALLAGLGLARSADVLSRWCSRRAALAAVVGVTLVQFSWSIPVSRSIGEEAWAARADVVYAKQFVQSLPANSIVLTHNPSLFHIWGISAAQLSLGQTVPGYLSNQLSKRYAGGVYLHWGFWCNVNDPVQTEFCRSMLSGFQWEQVASARERTYRYALYRLTVPAPR